MKKDHRARTGILNACTIVFVVAAALSLTVASSSPARAQDDPAPDSAAALVQSLYEGGSYLSAELEARRLLERDGLSDSIRILGEQYLSFALVAQGKNSSAREHFITILLIDSSYTLDPVLTSPKIISVFNQAYDRYLVMRSEENPPPTELPVVASGGITFRTLIFPGWEQIHQGRPTKGYILVGAGAASLGSFVVFDFLRRSAREDYLAAGTPERAASKYEVYNRYYKAQFYSGIAFVVVYFYSQFDAFFDLPPRLDTGVSAGPNGLQLQTRYSF